MGLDLLADVTMLMRISPAAPSSRVEEPLIASQADLANNCGRAIVIPSAVLSGS